MALFFLFSLAFGDRAEGTIPVHFTVTSCTGSETSLLNCTLNTDVSGFMFPQNTYNHDLDAFVVCRPKSESYSSESTQPSLATTSHPT